MQCIIIENQIDALCIRLLSLEMKFRNSIIIVHFTRFLASSRIFLNLQYQIKLILKSCEAFWHLYLNICCILVIQESLRPDY